MFLYFKKFCNYKHYRELRKKILLSSHNPNSATMIFFPINGCSYHSSDSPGPGCSPWLTGSEAHPHLSSGAAKASPLMLARSNKIKEMPVYSFTEINTITKEDRCTQSLAGAFLPVAHYLGNALVPCLVARQSNFLIV